MANVAAAQPVTHACMQGRVDGRAVLEGEIADAARGVEAVAFGRDGIGGASVDAAGAVGAMVGGGHGGHGIVACFAAGQF